MTRSIVFSDHFAYVLTERIINGKSEGKDKNMRNSIFLSIVFLLEGCPKKIISMKTMFKVFDANRKFVTNCMRLCIT